MYVARIENMMRDENRLLSDDFRHNIKNQSNMRKKIKTTRISELFAFSKHSLIIVLEDHPRLPPIRDLHSEAIERWRL